jgi:mevalonate kinase
MKKIDYIASAPATLKLLGEYAVLHNHLAIACAVDYRITCIIRPRNDNKIIINSSIKNYETTISALRIEPPLNFILASLLHFQQELPSGCEITIKEQFSATLGLGSSAAVTVACLTAIAMWLKLQLSELELLKIAHTIVLQVQKVASGIDLAASIFGGIISYRKEPLLVTKLNSNPKLALVYSGKKTTTVKSIGLVSDNFNSLSHIEKNIYNLIGACTEEAISSFIANDWHKLGLLFNIHHGLQEALGTGTEMLSQIVYNLRECDGIFGAKISGSGFGDCAIGLGEIAADTFPKNTQQNALGIKQIPIAISKTGVMKHD